MLKMFQTSAHAGSSSAYWDDNWAGDDLGESLRFCDVDPLRPVFEKYVPPGSFMLEGGCGMGQYLVYYGSRGRRVAGIDFAQNTLKRLRSQHPELMLSAGDVSRLPFADGTFDAYYSGGVVEHFENGCADALAEAYRVLKPGGTLLMSVPYQSPLRSLMSYTDRDLVRVKAMRTSSPPRSSAKFFQYIYKPAEFRTMLGEASFDVLDERGFSVLWGLYELPIIAQLRQRRNKTRSAEVPRPVQAEANVEVRPSFLKRLVVAEDDTIPVAGTGVRVMRYLCSNMMMYVSRKAR